MHLKKLKACSMGHMIDHYLRKYFQMDGHIDPKRTEKNRVLDGSLEQDISVKEINEMIQARVGQNKTIRKDATRMVDLIITQPKDLGSEYNEKFFKKMNEFCQDTFGKDNQLFSVVHLDEATPHMHYSFIPFVKDKDGTERLCCKEIMTKKFLLNFHKYAEVKTGYKLTNSDDDRKKNLSLSDYKKLMELKKENEELEKEKKTLIKQKKYWEDWNNELEKEVEVKKNEMKLLDKEYNELSKELNLYASQNASEHSVSHEKELGGVNIPSQKELSPEEIKSKYTKILENEELEKTEKELVKIFDKYKNKLSNTEALNIINQIKDIQKKPTKDQIKDFKNLANFIKSIIEKKLKKDFTR